MLELYPVLLRLQLPRERPVPAAWRWEDWRSIAGRWRLPGGVDLAASSRSASMPVADVTVAAVRRNPVGRRTQCVLRALVLGLCLLAASALAEAPPAARTWFVSGAELARQLQGKGEDGLCSGDQCRNLSSARASAYIQGVADAGRGHWCGQGHILPHELVDHVSSHIRQLPAERLHQDAASLVIEALESAFPCRQAASSRDRAHAAQSGR